MNSDTNIYEKWMRYAIIEAIKGLDDGEVPVGAVIVNQNKMDDTDEKYLINIKTVQSGAFRVLVEALKEILTDTNITFDE